MTGRQALAALFGLLCAIPAVSPAAAEIVLVENGVSRAPIVVFEGAPPFTRQAAEDLAGYLEKITGARPPVLTGMPEPRPETAIWVGWQPVLDELFPGVDFNFRHPEEILLAAGERHLVIAGRDRWNPAHMTAEGRRGNLIEGIQQEYGTANAVYTFLQEHLGVRWLWPGELGEDVPRRDTVALEPFEFRYHPQFRRRGILIMSDLADPRGRSRDFSRFQRLLLDSLVIPGGHAFSDWWDRYRETNPEYFALQPDGTRSGGRGAGGYRKTCESSPAVRERWLADVTAMLAHNPNLTVFNVSANDSHSTGICVCEACRAWDDPAGAPWVYSWQGLAQQYVAMTDRYLVFANKLADLLRENFPDRDDLFVYQMMYGPAKPLPVRTKPGERVIMSYVGHFPLTTESERAAQKAEMAPWFRLSPRVVYRPNLFYGGGARQQLPLAASARTAEDFRWLADHGCLGWRIDTAWESWATHGPQYYLMARLAWDPRADWRALMADYFRRGFGPAAGEVEAYWAMIERACDEIYALMENPAGRGRILYEAREKVYTDEFLAALAARLDRAAAAAGSEIHRRRVEFVRSGLEYTALFYRTVSVAEAARAGDEAARAQADTNRAGIERIFRAQPLALNAAFAGREFNQLLGE